MAIVGKEFMQSALTCCKRAVVAVADKTVSVSAAVLGPVFPLIGAICVGTDVTVGTFFSCSLAALASVGIFAAFVFPPDSLRKKVIRNFGCGLVTATLFPIVPLAGIDLLTNRSVQTQAKDFLAKEFAEGRLPAAQDQTPFAVELFSGKKDFAMISYKKNGDEIQFSVQRPSIIFQGATSKTSGILDLKPQG